MDVCFTDFWLRMVEATKGCWCRPNNDVSIHYHDLIHCACFNTLHRVNHCACSGESKGVLAMLDLPSSLVRNVIMSRDIVPRAFACDYSLVSLDLVHMLAITCYLTNTIINKHLKLYNTCCYVFINFTCPDLSLLFLALVTYIPPAILCTSRICDFSLVRFVTLKLHVRLCYIVCELVTLCLPYTLAITLEICLG